MQVARDIVQTYFSIALHFSLAVGKIPQLGAAPSGVKSEQSSFYHVFTSVSDPHLSHHAPLH